MWRPFWTSHMPAKPHVSVLPMWSNILQPYVASIRLRVASGNGSPAPSMRSMPKDFGSMPMLVGLLGDVEHVRGRPGHSIGLQLYDLVDPPFRVEGAARHYLAAQLFRSIMGLPESDVDVVAEGEEKPVSRPETRHPEYVAPRLDPPLPALVGLRDVDGSARRAARLPEGRHLLDGHAEEPP